MIDKCIKSSFSIKMVTDISIVLIDLDDGKSVTNDAPQVINYLNENLPGGIGSRKVYYKDTMGRFDQLKVKDGAFNGFAPCSDSQQTKIAKMLDSKNYFNGLISVTELSERTGKYKRWLQNKNIVDEMVNAGVAKRIGSTLICHEAAIEYIKNRPETRGRKKQK